MTGERTNCPIGNLDADTEYIFRVAAINKYGTGDFAEFSVTHTTAIPEESEEILEEKMEQEFTEEKIDEKQELPEVKKSEPKKAVMKDDLKHTEQLEEKKAHLDQEKTSGDLEQHDITELATKKALEKMTEVLGPDEKSKEELVEVDKKKVQKLEPIESEQQKPKKTKRRKPQKEGKYSEEITPPSQRESLHPEGQKILSKENSVAEEIKCADEMERNILEKNEVHAEEAAPLILEKKSLKEKVSRKEKGRVEVAAESDMKEKMGVEVEKKREMNDDELSGTLRVDQKAEVGLETQLTVEKKEKIKKTKSSKEKSQKTSTKKAAKPVVNAKVAEEYFNVQLPDQTIVVQEMTTSEVVKIEAEKEVKKDGIEDGYMEDSSKLEEEKDERQKKEKKIDELVSVDKLFKNITNSDSTDKVITILASKDETFASMKEVSKKKKLKTLRKLTKKKPEEITTTEQKVETEKPEFKIDDEVQDQKLGELKHEDVLKWFDSEQKSKEEKYVEDRDEKPKKVVGKKVTKKASQKSKSEESTERKKDQDTKEIKDEKEDEKNSEQKEVNGREDGEAGELKNADLNGTINIPAVPIIEISQLEDRTEAISVSAKDEIPVTRRVHKRPRGFVLPPDREILAFRNDTVKIECEVFNEDDKINWTINGRAAMDDERCTEVVDGFLRILQIENVVPEDTGLIIIVNLGEHSAESRLIIEDIPVEITEKLPHKMKGKMDDFVKLSITVSHAAENCQWYFDNKQLIENNDQYEVNVEGKICSLLIRNINYDQAGRYSAKVDSAETSTILIVEGPPVLLENELAVTKFELESQDNLVLTIPFKAVPEPTLECFLNSEKISSNSRIKLDILNDRAYFCKRKVDKSEAGEYTIKIKNDFGEVSRTFSVKIKGYFCLSFETKIKFPAFIKKTKLPSMYS